MGKQIQIVGQNVRPVVLKELDLNANGIFTFLKPSEDDVVEVNNSEFIRAVKDIDTFNKWVVEYKRDENTIIPLRIDKIEKKVIEPSSEQTLNLNELSGYTYYDLEGNGYATPPALPYLAYMGFWQIYSSPSAQYQFTYMLTNSGDIPVLTPPPTSENSNGVSSEYFESASYDADTKILTFALKGAEVGASEEAPKTEWHFSFTNDDVDVSAITLVKLEVVYTIEDDSIVATYVDETKEIEAGTVLPTPSGADDGKLLGVDDGAYAIVDNPIPSVSADDKDKYLHTNASTGDLEWASVSGGGGEDITQIDISSTSYAETYVSTFLNALPQGFQKGVVRITYNEQWYATTRDFYVQIADYGNTYNIIFTYNFEEDKIGKNQQNNNIQKANADSTSFVSLFNNALEYKPFLKVDVNNTLLKDIFSYCPTLFSGDLTINTISIKFNGIIFSNYYSSPNNIKIINFLDMKIYTGDASDVNKTLAEAFASATVETISVS